MTDSPKREHFIAASRHHREADDAFLRRILVGLIAATFISGAVTVTLTSQHDRSSEGFEVASTQGPA